MTDRDVRAFAKPFDRVENRYFQVTSRVWRLWPDNWPLAVSLHKLWGFARLELNMLRVNLPVKMSLLM